MRRKLIVPLVGLLAVLVWLGSFMPTSTMAAASQAPALQSTITGTLVATPQATVPTVLLLQVGGQTISVTITSGTQITNASNSPISLGQMVDGDTLQVVGEPDGNGGIDASLVQDVSNGVTTTGGTVEVTGALASEPAGVLCLQNASVISSAVRPQVGVVSACPSGQLPAYITGGTEFIGPSGQVISQGNLNIGDSLQVTGTLTSSQFTATVVQDLSTGVTTTGTVEVTGVLASEPAGVLCLQNASVINSSVSPQFGVVSACSSGQLPAYITGGTEFIGPFGQVISQGNLNIGDTLQVTGTLTSSQYTATVVQDLSTAVTATTTIAPAATTRLTLQGLLETTPNQLSAPLTLCLQPTARTIRLRGRQAVATGGACPSGQVAIYISNNTSIMFRANGTFGLDELRAGDTLQVTGTLSNGIFTVSQVRDLSIQSNFTSLMGTVLSVNRSARARSFTLRTANSGLITISLQGNTQIFGNSGTTYQASTIQPGQVVTVMGVYNRAGHRYNSTFRIRIH